MLVWIESTAGSAQDRRVEQPSFPIRTLQVSTRFQYGRSPVSLHFSPGGEAKCVRGLSVRGTGRLARGGVLEQYGEHGRQP